MIQDKYTMIISKFRLLTKEKNVLKIVASPILDNKYRTFHDTESKISNSNDTEISVSSCENNLERQSSYVLENKIDINKYLI